MIVAGRRWIDYDRAASLRTSSWRARALLLSFVVIGMDLPSDCHVTGSPNFIAVKVAVVTIYFSYRVGVHGPVVCSRPTARVSTPKHPDAVGRSTEQAKQARVDLVAFERRWHRDITARMLYEPGFKRPTQG